MTSRYLILGVGGLAVAVAVGLLIALGLRGLTATTPAANTPAPVTPTAAAPAPIEGAAPEAPAPRPEAGRNECVDALGDAAVDIDSVQVEIRDDDLAVQFRLAAPLPEGTAGVGLTVQRSGDKTYQLGVAFDDGQVDQVFVRDFDRSEDFEVDRYEVNVKDATITVVFPEDSIKRLGGTWGWYAFATAEGSDLDACPGTVADPEFQRFER